MQLSLNEVLVLSATGGRSKPRRSLAEDAARLAQSTKFDERVALTEIKTLEERRFLRSKNDNVELTREGWAALMEAMPVIESLRAAMGGASFRAGLS